MLKLLFALLISLLSLFSAPVTKIEIDNVVKPSCIRLINISGPYTTPSIYVTGIPADLQIIFSNGETVYRFQGLNDEAIRAQLPVGNYTVIVYYGNEQVSNIYYFSIDNTKTLMLSTSIPEECYPKPASDNKLG